MNNSSIHNNICDFLSSFDNLEKERLALKPSWQVDQIIKDSHSKNADVVLKLNIDQKMKWLTEHNNHPFRLLAIELKNKIENKADGDSIIQSIEAMCNGRFLDSIGIPGQSEYSLLIEDLCDKIVSLSQKYKMNQIIDQIIIDQIIIENNDYLKGLVPFKTTKIDHVKIKDHYFIKSEAEYIDLKSKTILELEKTLVHLTDFLNDLKSSPGQEKESLKLHGMFGLTDGKYYDFALNYDIYSDLEPLFYGLIKQKGDTYMQLSLVLNKVNSARADF